MLGPDCCCGDTDDCECRLSVLIGGFGDTTTGCRVYPSVYLNKICGSNTTRLSPLDDFGIVVELVEGATTIYTGPPSGLASSYPATAGEVWGLYAWQDPLEIVTPPDCPNALPQYANRISMFWDTDDSPSCSECPVDPVYVPITASSLVISGFPAYIETIRPLAISPAVDNYVSPPLAYLSSRWTGFDTLNATIVEDVSTYDLLCDVATYCPAIKRVGQKVLLGDVLVELQFLAGEYPGTACPDGPTSSLTVRVWAITGQYSLYGPGGDYDPLDEPELIETLDPCFWPTPPHVGPKATRSVAFVGKIISKSEPVQTGLPVYPFGRCGCFATLQPAPIPTDPPSCQRQLVFGVVGDVGDFFTAMYCYNIMPLTLDDCLSGGSSAQQFRWDPAGAKYTAFALERIIGGSGGVHAVQLRPPCNPFPICPDLPAFIGLDCDDPSVLDVYKYATFLDFPTAATCPTVEWIVS